jgi:hypothetical protein
MSNLYKAPTAQIQRKTALTSLTGGLGKLFFVFFLLSLHFFLFFLNNIKEKFKIVLTFEILNAIALSIQVNKILFVKIKFRSWNIC